MLPDEFKRLTLIPAHELAKGLNKVPADPGVYLWFVRGGRSMLEQSSYFTTEQTGPLLRIEAGEHLYTGAARNLRFRISQHLVNIKHENSSPRKSLVALERRFGAVSKAVDSIHNVTDDDGLTAWIFENVTFGIEPTPKALSRELKIIIDYASPFNIAHRRAHRYSKWLMAWRADAFPADWQKHIPLQQRDPFGDLPLRDPARPRRKTTRTRGPARRRLPHQGIDRYSTRTRQTPSQAR